MQSEALNEQEPVCKKCGVHLVSGPFSDVFVSRGIAHTLPTTGAWPPAPSAGQQHLNTHTESARTHTHTRTHTHSYTHIHTYIHVTHIRGQASGSLSRTAALEHTHSYTHTHTYMLPTSGVRSPAPSAGQQHRFRHQCPRSNGCTCCCSRYAHIS